VSKSLKSCSYISIHGFFSNECIVFCACKEFQVFHFGVIVKLFYFLSCSSFFSFLFIAFFKNKIMHIKVIWCQGK
jgi:hypothetical protein